MKCFDRGFCNGIFGLSEQLWLHHMLVGIVCHQHLFLVKPWGIVWALKECCYLQCVLLNSYRRVPLSKG